MQRIVKVCFSRGLERRELVGFGISFSLMTVLFMFWMLEFKAARRGGQLFHATVVRMIYMHMRAQDLDDPAGILVTYVCCYSVLSLCITSTTREEWHAFLVNRRTGIDTRVPLHVSPGLFSLFCFVSLGLRQVTCSF